MYQVTQKGLNLIHTEIIDGDLYALMDKNADTEIWIKASPLKEPICSRCGYTGWIVEKHHIHGRKNSNETILLCPNCHKEKHRGLW